MRVIVHGRRRGSPSGRRANAQRLPYPDGVVVEAIDLQQVTHGDIVTAGDAAEGVAPGNDVLAPRAVLLSPSDVGAIGRVVVEIALHALGQCLSHLAPIADRGQLSGLSRVGDKAGDR